MYKVFTRSARNFQEFSTAPKKHMMLVDTLEEAQEACKEWNDNRTPEQIRKGTKAEFESLL